MEDFIKEIATDIIKMAAPVTTAYLGYRISKRQFDIERIRLHEKDQVDAYKRLHMFAHNLRNSTFPLADDKRQTFINLMRSDYLGKLELDYVYFSDGVTKILENLEERFLCMTRGELIPEMDQRDEEEFVERELPRLADSLTKHVRKAMSAKRITA